MAIDLHVNGKKHRVDLAPEVPLLSALRDHIGLTGTKYGCGESQCGACTVLIDGRATRSCITPIRLAAGKAITTIEGLEQNGKLNPVQEAFIETDAMQCGYCTPGMIMTATGLLQRTPNPSAAEIKRAMQGNVCRCGTYPRIVEAVQMAARTRRAGK